MTFPAISLSSLAIYKTSLTAYKVLLTVYKTPLDIYKERPDTIKWLNNSFLTTYVLFLQITAYLAVIYCLL